MVSALPGKGSPTSSFSGGGKVQEGVVDVALARILTEFGVGSAALVQFDGIPDVYLLSRGLRVIIEAKEQGRESQLHEQLLERLEKNLCDVAIGITFPRSVVSGLAAPSPQEVERRLHATQLGFSAFRGGDPTPVPITEGRECRLADLPELITSVASQAVPEGELERAVEDVRSAIDRFVTTVQSSPSEAEVIGKTLARVLQGDAES
jgi:hypothetical protein